MVVNQTATSLPSAQTQAAPEKPVEFQRPPFQLLNRSLVGTAPGTCAARMIRIPPPTRKGPRPGLVSDGVVPHLLTAVAQPKYLAKGRRFETNGRLTGREQDILRRDEQGRCKEGPVLCSRKFRDHLSGFYPDGRQADMRRLLRRGPAPASHLLNLPRDEEDLVGQERQLGTRVTNVRSRGPWSYDLARAVGTDTPPDTRPRPMRRTRG